MPDIKRLKIIEIEGSGNNGIIFKAIEHWRLKALKVMYGFSNPEIIIEKSLREFETNKELNAIKGIPKAYNYYGSFNEKENKFDSFNCKGFDYEVAKEFIKSNRVIHQSDNFQELIFAGAYTMEFMPIFSKLPKEYENINYSLPQHFFNQLRTIADKMLKRGYSLPKENDICFDKKFNPIVVDFGNCESINELIQTARSEKSALNYIKAKNEYKISSLERLYK